MFYAHFVLAKKGPLARIWLAAHWDKKLTKAQVYETNIEESVVGIMQPKVKMALRTSGHLLLGVVKIYSRKAKYLLADCNEAFAKIKMAFRPGMVDMPLDKREAAINAITLPDYFNDVDTEVPTLDDMVDFMDGGEFMMMSHTRADEITLRDDYAGVMLEDEQEGFDGSLEIMRDAGSHQRGSGSLQSARISLDQDMSRLRDQQFGFESSIEGPSIGMHSGKNSQYGPSRPTSDAMSGIFAESGLPFNASAQGSLDNVTLQPPSPGNSLHNGGDSRPITPLEDTGLEAVGGEDAVTAGGLLTPPSLNATPTVSRPSSAPPPPTPSPAPTEHMLEPLQHDQTTLLQNEDESFALAPIDASALQKGGRRKRKRKLVVDYIKAFTGEEMKSRLLDSSDLVTTLDIAPPTKRLMHWTAIGGVDELFSMPCHPIHKGAMLDQYKKGLKAQHNDDEHFPFVIDHPGQDFQLQHISPEKRVDRVRGSATKMRPVKRKRQELLMENSYAKRQQELVCQQEEFAREFRGQNISLSVQEDLMQVSGVEERLGASDFSNFDDLPPLYPPPASPPGIGSPASLQLPPSPSLPRASLESPLQTDISRISTAPSLNISLPPSANISLPPKQNTRRSSRLAEPMMTFDSEPMTFDAPSFGPMSPADVPLPMSPDFDDGPAPFNDDASVVDDYPAIADDAEADNYADDDYPEVVDNYPAVVDDYPASVEAGAYSDGEVSFASVRERSAYTNSANVTDQSQMFDDESLEAYETRVVNKKAILLHKVLEHRFKEADKIDFSSLVNEKQNRKHVAQAFYSFLLLNKHDALTGTQETIFAPLVLQQTPGFNTALQRL